MGAQFDVAVSGINELKRAVQEIERTAAAELKLQQQSISTSNAIRTQLAAGFQALEAALRKSTAETSKHTAAAKADNAERVKQISSLKQLATAWMANLTPIREINEQLLKQVSSSQAVVNGMRQLTLSTNQYTVAARESFIADQANLSQAGKISSAYAKISALIGERKNLESGVSQVLSRRTAEEQALLAVEQQRSAVSGITLRNIQSRIIAESNLTNTQKIRAMVELGLVDAETKGNAAKAKAAATNQQLAGTYAMLEKEQKEALAMNQAYNTKLATGYVHQQKLKESSLQLRNSQTALGSAFRGAGAAAGTLFLTYGQIIPMATAFAATAIAIKAVKLGVEFDYITRYATAVAESTGDASVSLGRLQGTILGFQGLSRGPIEIAEGYKELVKAGYSASESLKQVEYATKFAVVSEMELGDATQSLVGLTRAFAEEGQDMADVADIIAKAALISSTDVKEMTDAMAHMTELSSVAGVSLKEAATAMGILANAGIRGSKAATSIRTAVLRVLSPTESLKRAMDAAGVSIDAVASDGKVKSFKALFEAVQSILSVIPKREQVSFLANMFDIRTLKGAANLLESIRTGSWDQFAAQLENARGYVGALHSELQKSSKFWADEISASFERAAVSAFQAEGVTEVLKSINDIVADPVFAQGLELVAVSLLKVADSILRVGSEGVTGSALRFVGAVQDMKASISAYYDLPSLGGGSDDGGWAGRITKFFLNGIDPLRRYNSTVEFTTKLLGKATDAVVGFRREQFLGGMSKEVSFAKIPETGATGTFTPAFLNTGGYLRQADEVIEKNQKLSYSFVSLDPTVGGLQDRLNKDLEQSREHLANSLGEDEKFEAKRTLIKEEAARKRYEIEQNSALAVPELQGQKKALLDQAAQWEQNSLKALENAHVRSSAKIGEIAETTAQKLGKLQNTKFQFMPDGMAKDLEEVNTKYRQGVEAVEPYLRSQGEVGDRARETLAVLNKWKKDATFEVQKKYAEEYSDAVLDARNSLDSLSSRDNALGGMAREMEKIGVNFEKFRNTQMSKIFDIGNDTSTEAQNTATALKAIVEESHKVEAGMKAAFKAEVVKGFKDDLLDINDQYREADAHTSRLKTINKAYDDLSDKVREMYKEDAEGVKISAEGLEILGLINKEKERTIESDIEALKTSNSLWGGFHAGALEAQRDLRKLGDLGYEIFQDLHEGLKNVFVDVLNFDFGNIKNSFNDMLKSMKNTAVDWAADRLATASTSLLDEILGDIGLGSFAERGSRSNPMWVRSVDGSFGGGSGGGFLGAAGGLLGKAKDWVGSIFGESAASWVGTAASALGLAGGAYGLFSGLKNLGKGNTGAGLMQTAAGATSMYKGAVGLDLIAKGTATDIAKGVAGYFGIGSTATAGTTAGVSTMAPVGYSAASSTAPAWQGAYLSSQGGATGAAGSSAATGSSSIGSSSAGVSSSSIGAGAAIGIAAFTFGKILGSALKGQVHPDAEIDVARITPDHLKAFTEGIVKLNGTILAGIPGVNRYESAHYDANSQVLTLYHGMHALALSFDGAAQAGHQWKEVATAETQQLEERNKAESMYFRTGTQSMENFGNGINHLSQASVEAKLKFEQQYLATVNVVSASEQFSDNATGMSMTIEQLTARQSALAEKYKQAESGTSSLAAVIGKFAPGAESSENAVWALTDSFENMTSKMSDMKKMAIAFSTISLPAGSQSMENAKGGFIGYAGGGVLHGGSGVRDDIYLGTVNGRAQFAMGGEYIVNKKSTRKHRNLLEHINSDTYAEGGDLPGLMSGVYDTIAKYTKTESGYSLYRLGEDFKELSKSLKEAGASAEQLAAANKAYSLERAAMYGPKSETVKDIMDSIADRRNSLTLSGAAYDKYSVQKEYQKTIATLKEYGASTQQISAVQKTYALELAKAYGPKSDAVAGLMQGVYDTIAESKMSEAQIEIRNVNIEYKKLIKDLKESGASASQVALATQAWKIELDAINDKPLKEASSALKSFTDGLKGVTDESADSAMAQAKLMAMLGKAKKGDFSGVEKLSEILDDIVIKKEDYASALDYSRAYWKTVGAATQLTGLIDKKVAVPGYATGGIHPGGLRVVGESGPELEVTGPSRIYNQGQLIDVAAILEELRALRAEVVNGNYAVAKNTMKTAESLQRIEYDGIYLDAGSM